MRILVFFLLFLRFGGCTKNQIELKTVTAGGSVRLECPRTNSQTIFWIRAVPGNLPEFLGKSPDSKLDRFTTRTEPGTLVLVIKNSGVTDTGVYICMTPGKKPTFLKRTDLTVVDSKHENLTKVHPSDPTPGEHSMFLPCSFYSENTTFGNGTKGSCCGSGPAQPFFSFLCKNIVEASQNDLKYFSWQDSGNSSFRNISSFENLCCSVAKCETGNSSVPKTEVQNPECPKDNTVLYVLSAALFLSLTVIVFLIYSSTKPKNSLCGCCAANSPPQRNAVKVSVDPLKQQSVEEEEQDLVYAVPVITRKKTVKSQDAEKEECFYTSVCYRDPEPDAQTSKSGRKNGEAGDGEKEQEIMDLPLLH